MQTTALNDWNELRLVLAISRAGTLANAAKVLEIDHSTVFRRLTALEARLGVRLFERLPGGSYVTTPAGERMYRAAERMEDEAVALARDIAGQDRRLSGRLRITSSETLAYRVLTDQILAFRHAHPGITVELVIDNRVLSLSRREADVALRPLRPKEGDLWGRKLADVAWTIYGASDYVENHGMLGITAELARHPVIAWDELTAGIGAAEWVTGMTSEDSIVYRSSSLINQLVAARAGIGLAVLPCYLADPEPGLKRALAEPIPQLARELWLVTHDDLKTTARVRAFFDIVGERLARQAPLFAGEQPQYSTK